MAALILGFLTLLVDDLERKRFRAEQQSEVIEQTSDYRAKLEMSLNARLHLLRGLAAYVKLGEPVDQSFAVFAKELIAGRNDIRSLTLAPNNVVRWVYPEENNRLALGVNLLEVPRFKNTILRTIDGNQMTLAGPHDLIQGGQGLMARLPIVWNTDQGSRLWGLAIIVIELQPLLYETGIQDNEMLEFALRGTDGLGADGAVFYGSDDLFDGRSVILEVSVPAGVWQLAARPKSGWVERSPYQGTVRGIGLLAAMLVACVIYGLLDQGQKLKFAYSTLREREAEFRHTMEAAQVGIFRARDGVVTYGNRGFNTLFALTSKETKPRMDELVCEDDRRQLMLNLEVCQNGSPIAPYKIMAISRDGTRFPALVTMNGMQTGRIQQVAGSVVDLSDLAKAEAELRMAVEALLKSNDELERFAYVASHDLQEPLRSITGFAQLLDRRLTDRLGPDEREFLNFIVAGAKRMHALVNDLLIYSRVTHQSAPFGPVALDRVVEQSVRNLHDTITASGVNLEIAPLGVVWGDESQLIQVVQNLIANGIKFSRPDQLPVVQIWSERNGERVELRIADNGIGIPAEYRDQIFTIFKRLHPMDRYPGTGVGLAICRRIVDRHGGEIWVETNSDNGCTFVVRLTAHDSIANADGAQSLTLPRVLADSVK